MTHVKLNNRPVNRVFNTVFDDLLNQFPATWKDSALHYPPVNIHETKDAYHVELSAAGLSKEDFQVKVEEGLLTISFERRKKQKLMITKRCAGNLHNAALNAAFL